MGFKKLKAKQGDTAEAMKVPQDVFDHLHLEAIHNNKLMLHFGKMPRKIELFPSLYPPFGKDVKEDLYPPSFRVEKQDFLKFYKEHLKTEWKSYPTVLEDKYIGEWENNLNEQDVSPYDNRPECWPKWVLEAIDFVPMHQVLINYHISSNAELPPRNADRLSAEFTYCVQLC